MKLLWTTSRYDIDLRTPRVMGIVNVTPDSFSDAGQYAGVKDAMAHCEQLLREGADILDIGGESTRPGAPPLSLEDELVRVVPLVKEAVRLGVPISVDTYKPRVMQAVMDLGVDIINDVWALRWQHADASLSGAQVIANHPRCGVCLMHMHLEPQTMQIQPMEGDVVGQVLRFLEQSVQVLSGLMVDRTRILLDPGIGFGKTAAQNFSLLARQRELLASGYPLLLGWSRKSSLAVMGAKGSETGLLSIQHRLIPSVAAALLAVERGASVVRVHDVKETVQALQVFQAAR